MFSYQSRDLVTCQTEDSSPSLPLSLGDCVWETHWVWESSDSYLPPNLEVFVLPPGWLRGGLGRKPIVNRRNRTYVICDVLDTCVTGSRCGDYWGALLAADMLCQHLTRMTTCWQCCGIDWKLTSFAPFLYRADLWRVCATSFAQQATILHFDLWNWETPACEQVCSNTEN